MSATERTVTVMLKADTSRLYAELDRAARSAAVIRAVARDFQLNPEERRAKLTAQMQVRPEWFMSEFEWTMRRPLGWRDPWMRVALHVGVSQERFEELCRLAREEPLFPGQADDNDPTLLSPDAARWTPEDDG